MFSLKAGPLIGSMNRRPLPAFSMPAVSSSPPGMRIWPVGTRVLVASVEFSGEWGVIIERIDDYPADWPWNEADPVPFIEINRFLRSTEPLEVAP